MQIFNRWGEKLFESSQIDDNSELSGWDGTFENKIYPLGVYYYQVFVESDDTTEMYKGSVTLLR